jgi:EAL domain-containing protein (putative c-di-GMP-specific phosphodiesterase class I)
MKEHDRYGEALTNFALREAIACAGRWHDAGRELGIAINLSVRAFDRLDLPERVEDLARDSHVPPEFITLEVTETEVVRDAVKMIDVATRLRLKGFRLSIDDFGTGQSGLSQLQKLPFSGRKVRPQLQPTVIFSVRAVRSIGCSPS